MLGKIGDSLSVSRCQRRTLLPRRSQEPHFGAVSFLMRTELVVVGLVSIALQVYLASSVMKLCGGRRGRAKQTGEERVSCQPVRWRHSNLESRKVKRAGR